MTVQQLVDKVMGHLDPRCKDCGKPLVKATKYMLCGLCGLLRLTKSMSDQPKKKRQPKRRK